MRTSKLSGQCLECKTGLRRTNSSVLAGNEMMRYEVDLKKDFIETEIDVDWARCSRTRRSTSGGEVCFLGCLICSKSRVQQTVVCSSAESEYHSLCSEAAESLSVRALSNELGLGVKHIYISTNWSAAKAMSPRFSVPTRANRTSVRILFFQQLVRNRHRPKEDLHA